MFTEYPLINFRDCSGAMLSKADVTLVPTNAAVLSLGFRYDNLGRATQRTGYSQVGSGLPNAACRGLTGFVNAASTIGRVVGAFNGASSAWNGTTWTNIGVHASSTAKVRYASFLDLVFRVGGGDATKSWNGSVASSFGTAQLTSAPDGAFVLPYKAKLLIGGGSTFPDRVYQSSVPDVNGDITWDSLDYLEVNPNDGDTLTGFAKAGSTALFFKRNYIYRWNGTSTDPEPMINVGAISQEVIAEVNGTVFFASAKGIYSTDGGAPVLVSGPVQDYFDAIPEDNYASMSASGDIRRYALHCGNVTAKGRTFTNLVIEYDMQLQLCWAHEYGDQMTACATVISVTGGQYIVSATTGKVMAFDGSFTDNGTAISFERTVRTYLGGESETKVVNDVSAYMSGCPTAVFSAKTKKGLVKVFGTTDRPTKIFKGRELKFDGWCDFTVSGLNSNAPCDWGGFEIIRSRSLGNLS